MVSVPMNCPSIPHLHLTLNGAARYAIGSVANESPTLWAVRTADQRNAVMALLREVSLPLLPYFVIDEAHGELESATAVLRVRHFPAIDTDIHKIAGLQVQTLVLDPRHGWTEFEMERFFCRLRPEPTMLVLIEPDT